MKKKDIILHLVQILLIIVFVASIVSKTFQNDTFFTIAIGENIVSYGVEKEEKLVWHEGLEFTNPRWLFDVIIYTLYNQFGFVGIHIFTIIFAIAQALIFYYILNRISKKKFLSFIYTIMIMYLIRMEMVARAQIISFTLFLIEFYCIEKLLETNTKRYFITLVIIPLILCNVHASVFPIYFIFYLPYLVEYFMFKTKIEAQDEKLIIEKRNIKPLLILMLIGAFAGFLTPDGVEPYEYLIKNISGMSAAFIAELQPWDITIDQFILYFVVAAIMVLVFSKTKARITDIIFIIGFLFMTLMILRSVYFFYLISTICIFRIINDFFETYNADFEFKSKLLICSIIYIIILIISIINFVNNKADSYIDYEKYPVNAVEYILENVDVSNMKIYNHFNFGSYLELNEIPAFIDSRSEIYTEEFNPETTILQDWVDVLQGKVHYSDIFDKYGITHALLYKEEVTHKYISRDPNWKVLYEDEYFILYEKNY